VWQSVNPYIRTDHYPIPIIDEIMSNIAGHEYYCVLDLKGAYQQLELSEAARKLLVINTHKGLYAYRRLAFGVKPAASIFQSVMDTILQGIEGVYVHIDDIVIVGNDLETVKGRLRQVLKRLQEYRVKVNYEKCKWFQKQVEFLGHIVSKMGIQPNPEKITTVVEAPIPKNPGQMKSFLGMINFYAKFVPKLSEKLLLVIQSTSGKKKKTFACICCWNLYGSQQQMYENFFFFFPEVV